MYNDSMMDRVGYGGYLWLYVVGGLEFWLYGRDLCALMSHCIEGCLVNEFTALFWLSCMCIASKRYIDFDQDNVHTYESFPLREFLTVPFSTQNAQYNRRPITPYADQNNLGYINTNIAKDSPRKRPPSSPLQTDIYFL